MRAIITVLSVILLVSCQPNKEYIRNEGMVFGTTFHMVYQSDSDLFSGIMKQVATVDWSLSPFKDTSIISRVNQNDSSVVLDHHFLTVFNKSVEVNAKTEGAFDITVAPLVNAWGFGFSKKETVNRAKIDSILEFVGMKKVSLKNGRIYKSDPRTKFDASAIAKGYGVDVAALYLESAGVENYMVEIGGEIRAKGVNAKGKPWSVGIDKPIDDPTVSQRQLETVLRISNQSLATSGNYRNFYYEGNEKRAHTISPQTGYPVQTNVLSASVVAPDCMTADAYATAFMVLGLDKSLAIANADPDLETYLIYDDNGVMKSAWTSGFDNLIEK